MLIIVLVRLNLSWYPDLPPAKSFHGPLQLKKSKSQYGSKMIPDIEFRFGTLKRGRAKVEAVEDSSS